MTCSGHAYQHELLLYTENCFVILKNIFTGSTLIDERLATLYLMYAMYFKQPTKDFCKFRFTLNDWIKMKHFYDAISLESKYLQARAIFWRLWQANALRFVECDLEHYPETMQFHRLGNDRPSDFQKINSTIIGSVKELQNESKGLLTAIETLQVGYNEMKDHFAANLHECANLQSIDVIGGINAQMKQIQKLFQNKYDGSSCRKKEKQKLMEKNSTFGESSKATKESDTDIDIDSELNVSTSSYSGSNDDDSYSENEDDATNQCLNIGSKRYYLKRRALQKETGELHRLKSTMAQPMITSPKKATQTDIIEDSNWSKPVQRAHPEIQNQISVNDVSGKIVINHPKKVYNRHSKLYKSAIRKQFIECPA